MWKCLASNSCSAAGKFNPTGNGGYRRLLFILVLRSYETSHQLRRFDLPNFSVVNDGTKSINNNWIVLFFNRFTSNHGLIRMLNQSAGYAWCVKFLDLFEGK